MHQRPEQRLRELDPDDICNFCDAASSDYGPEHLQNCPRYISQEELDDEPVLDESLEDLPEEDDELFV